MNITVTYANNGELPGFDVEINGHDAEPLDIGRFNDAVLVSDAGFGEKVFDSETSNMFVKHENTLHLESYFGEQKRVALSLAESYVAIRPDFCFVYWDSNSLYERLQGSEIPRNQAGLLYEAARGLISIWLG